MINSSTINRLLQTVSPQILSHEELGDMTYEFDQYLRKADVPFKEYTSMNGCWAATDRSPLSFHHAGISTEGSIILHFNGGKDKQILRCPAEYAYIADIGLYVALGNMKGDQFQPQVRRVYLPTNYQPCK